MRAICIGRLSYDINLPLPEYPNANKDYINVSRVEGGSGLGLIGSTLFNKWGFDANVVGVVGNDMYGTRIKTELESTGVNTKNLEVNYEKETIVNYIINSDVTGDSTKITSAFNGINLTRTTLEVENADALLIDGNEYEMSINTLIRYKSAASAIVPTVVTKEILDLCGRVQYIILNISLAEEISGVKTDIQNPNTLVQMYQILKDKFKKPIIITMGDKGVLYAIEYDVRIMPAVKVNPKDTTSAREIFAAAFLHSIASNKKYETALKIANMAAGISVTKVGLKNSIFKLEEIEVFARNLGESIY